MNFNEFNEFFFLSVSLNFINISNCRTSGEIRLSDFLLWQCNYSSLAFTDVLWPETTFFEFSKLILKYQLDKLFNHNSQIEQVIKSNNGQFDCAHHSDLKQFVDNELDKHLSKLKSNGV